MHPIIRRAVARAAWIACGASFAHASLAQETGCGGLGITSGTYKMAHQRATRVFRVYVPAGYRSNVPARLLLVFHGWGGDEGEFLGDETVIREADARGYVVVAPRGLGEGPPDQSRNSWTFRGSATGVDVESAHRTLPAAGLAVCDTAITPDYRYPSCRTGTAQNSCSWTQCQDDDVDFAVALVKHVEAALCIDATRVFAVGGSNGGMFAWELGQNPRSAPVFRAIAPVIGLPHRGYLDGPGKPGGMPVILITGVSDRMVPPGGWDDLAYTTTSNDGDRYYYTGASAITKRWSAAAGCDTSGKEMPFENGYAQADCRSYCPGSLSKWPTVLDCRANTGHDYNLSWTWKMILDFFDRF